MTKMEGQWYSDEHMNRVMKKLYDYESRIKKAIEYIKENEKEYDSLLENEEIILDILEGKKVEKVKEVEDDSNGSRTLLDHI